MSRVNIVPCTISTNFRGGNTSGLVPWQNKAGVVVRTLLYRHNHGCTCMLDDSSRFAVAAAAACLQPCHVTCHKCRCPSLCNVVLYALHMISQTVANMGSRACYARSRWSRRRQLAPVISISMKTSPRLVQTDLCDVGS